MQSVLKKLVWFVLGFVIFLFALVYIATPYAARHFARAPLAELGIALDDNSYVTYNLLTSTLIVDDLVILDAQQQPVASIDRLRVSVHLTKLLFSRFHIADVELLGGVLKAEKSADKMIIAGVNLATLASEPNQAEPAAPEPSEPSAYLLTLDQLIVKDFVVMATVDGHAHRLAIDNFTLEDVAVDAQAQRLQLALQTSLDEATFSLATDVELADMQGEADVSFDLQNLSLATYQHLLGVDDLSVAGTVSLHGAPTVRLTKSNIEVAMAQFELALDQLSVGLVPWMYSGESHAVTVSDLRLQFAPKTSEYAVQSHVDIDFSQGVVALEREDNRLATWDAITLAPVVDVASDHQQVDIEQLQVEGITLSSVAPTAEVDPMVSFDNLQVANIDYSGHRVEIDAVLLGAGRTVVKVNQDKSIANLIDLSALSGAEEVPADSTMTTAPEAPAVVEPEVAQTTDSSAPVTVKLGEFRLTAPLMISAHDESVSPVYAHQLQVDELNMGTIDTAEPSAKTPVSLQVKDDEYFTLTLNGDVSPLGEKIDASLKGDLKELTLNEISPYMKDALGFEMKSGQLDVALDIGIEQDELSGNTLLNMRGIEMTKADDYEQGTIKEGQAMPLNVALGMLKDSQGNIELEVPMSGNLADPSFGISSFLTLILKKAAMSQAKSYLMQTFVPYANVVSVVMSGAEYLLKLRLEPLVYTPGQIEFSEQQQAYLAQLTQLLIDKPDVQVKTCAVSTPADIGVAVDAELSKQQSGQLVDIGLQRQALLKNLLVKQGNVPSSRVLTCAPEIDRSDDGAPRIELKTD